MIGIKFKQKVTRLAGCPASRVGVLQRPARRAVLAPLLAVALVSGFLGVAHATAARSRAHHPTAVTLEDRVHLVAKELDLDARQQASLKDILLAQRAEVAKVWSDSSVPAAVRVGATQAVSERTAERIRAILTPEQREKYVKDHNSETSVGTPGVDLQKWLTPVPGPG